MFRDFHFYTQSISTQCRTVTAGAEFGTLYERRCSRSAGALDCTESGSFRFGEQCNVANGKQSLVLQQCFSTISLSTHRDTCKMPNTTSHMDQFTYSWVVNGPLHLDCCVRVWHMIWLWKMQACYITQSIGTTVRAGHLGRWSTTLICMWLQSIQFIWNSHYIT